MIAIINTGVANLRSVANALDRVGRPYSITTDAAEIQEACSVILPGVGHAKASMKSLQQLQLIPIIRGLQQPLLGICLGMQILYEHTAEGDTACLGVVPGRVERIANHALSLPHMGWNNLNFDDPASPLFRDIPEFSRVYFVHSFRAPMSSATQASTFYGEAIPAIVSYKNFHGTQFHPERSGPIGLQIIRNFLDL